LSSEKTEHNPCTTPTLLLHNPFTIGRRLNRDMGKMGGKINYFSKIMFREVIPN